MSWFFAKTRSAKTRSIFSTKIMSGLSLNRLLRNNRRLVRAKQCCERACSKAEDIKSHARTKRQFEAVECVSETRYPITLRSEPRTKWILNCANVVLGICIYLYLFSMHSRLESLLIKNPFVTLSASPRSFSRERHDFRGWGYVQRMYPRRREFSI